MSDNTFYSEYVRDMFITEAGQGYLDLFDVLHGAVGLADEAAEVLGAVKKAAFTGKKLDRGALILELGDVEFYLQALRNSLGVTRTEILEANIRKLGERHPDGIKESDFYAK